ncbi:hypothetical protein NLU13_1500 [Sarocladium strictum]|uniref:Uncharacterized protein n=1 Tax=Sarocladium strictum TaxID=5046 RepID=A0AA39GR38_SARSR|nr:hypothetical protein NLU13_1500 [Sarocladium strictum]
MLGMGVPSSNWRIFAYAEMVVALTGGLLYSQGYHNECLALLAAYPVALAQKLKGNTCEPDVTRYCQETAIALYHMRDKHELATSIERSNAQNCSHSDHSNHGEMSKVDCFFEVFSLHLEMEYQRHHTKTRMPSLGPEHIMYNLRNHFENIVDWGNMNERRTPIVRENADLMALSGRQCHVSARIDAQPLALIWAFDIASLAVALILPLQIGYLFQSDGQTVHNPGDKPPVTSHASVSLCMLLSAILSAAIITLIDELNGMWDPYGRGLNTFSWTLGIAMEIDTMLNEFYESDDNVIRKLSTRAAVLLGEVV